MYHERGEHQHLSQCSHWCRKHHAGVLEPGNRYCSSAKEEASDARSPHLLTLVTIKYVAHSSPSVVPKQLYRKLPSPQLQLKLFPPWGSELEPQLFKEMRHKILLLLGRWITCEVLKTPFEPWKEGSEAVQSRFTERPSTCSAHFWLRMKRLGSKVRDYSTCKTNFKSQQISLLCFYQSASRPCPLKGTFLSFPHTGLVQGNLFPQHVPFL